MPGRRVVRKGLAGAGVLARAEEVKGIEEEVQGREDGVQGRRNVGKKGCAGGCAGMEGTDFE